MRSLPCLQDIAMKGPESVQFMCTRTRKKEPETIFPLLYTLGFFLVNAIVRMFCFCVHLCIAVKVVLPLIVFCWTLVSWLLGVCPFLFFTVNNFLYCGRNSFHDANNELGSPVWLHGARGFLFVSSNPGEHIDSVGMLLLQEWFRLLFKNISVLCFFLFLFILSSTLPNFQVNVDIHKIRGNRCFRK